jgi:hypothetical protein
MKIFISQPMRGIDDATVKAVRQRAIDFLNNAHPGCEIISTYYEGPSNPPHPVECLGESIKKLSSADRLYLCAGWEKARGCVIESEVAHAYGIPVEYEMVPGNGTLADSIPFMLSENYKDRMYGEYLQVKRRFNSLHKIIIKSKAGTLEFEPKCKVSLLVAQYNAMKEYMEHLETRMEIEGVEDVFHINEGE